MGQGVPRASGGLESGLGVSSRKQDTLLREGCVRSRDKAMEVYINYSEQANLETESRLIRVGQIGNSVEYRFWDAELFPK